MSELFYLISEGLFLLPCFIKVRTKKQIKKVKEWVFSVPQTLQTTWESMSFNMSSCGK